MPIEHEIRDGALVWIKNPITGVISYVVDVRGKSFAFTLGGREELNPDLPPVDPKALRNAMAACPFCPGNEHMAPAELMRVTPADFPNWPGAKSVEGAEWIMRVFNNLFPRIPEKLTGGRSESYIVIEDPRHFSAHPRSVNDLVHTGALGEEHFYQLLMVDRRVSAQLRHRHAGFSRHGHRPLTQRPPPVRARALSHHQDPRSAAARLRNPSGRRIAASCAHQRTPISLFERGGNAEPAEPARAERRGVAQGSRPQLTEGPE